MASTLNSRICVQDRLALLAAYERNEQSLFSKVLQSYPEVINYLLEKYGTNQAIVKYDSVIRWYAQPTNMTSHQIYEG